jgi:hypothetical protein
MLLPFPGLLFSFALPEANGASLLLIAIAAALLCLTRLARATQLS